MSQRDHDTLNLTAEDDATRARSGSGEVADVGPDAASSSTGPMTRTQTSDTNVEMLELMRQQVNIMQQILEQGSPKEGTSSVSQEILAVLRRIDERQENAGQFLL